MAKDAIVGNREQATASPYPGGATVRRLVRGERLAVAEYTVPTGFEVGGDPAEHEKVGYVVSGRLAIETEAGTQVVESGGGYAIPAGVRHRFRVLAAALIVQADG